MASNHTDSLKQRALIRALPRTGGSLPSLEQDWLQDELGLDSPKHLKRMWKDYLIALGVTLTSLNGMMKNWLEAAGYSGSLYSMIRDYWADREALLFSVLSPRASGEISIEPLNGEGSATFTRSTVAHVRDFENVYRQVASGEARIQGARRVENLLTRSNEFDHADWNPTNSPGIVDNGDNSWTITTTAAGNTDIFIEQIGSFPSLGTAQVSVYIKSVTGAPSAASLLLLGYTSPSTYREETLVDISGATSSTFQRYTSIRTFTTATTDQARIMVRLSRNGATNASVTIKFAQIENATGRGDTTAPSEYIATTTAAVSKYYTTTNGNSVSSNVVTEASGVSLHPTVSKKGANVLARYATRADSTAYVLGDRVITVAGSGTAGGDGYVHEITTAGTSDSSEPVFNTTIGGTTTDNTATWTNMGHAKIAGYLGEPVGTNSILQSREFETTWGVTGTPVFTQDQDGVDGVANTAWQVNDNDGAAHEFFRQDVTVPADTNTHCFSVFILKDTDTTRFPSIYLRMVTGGTDTSEFLQVNTQTGASVEVGAGAAGFASSSVEDHGLWWRVVVTMANTSNTLCRVDLYPADGAVFGTRSTAATGTTIFDQAQLELNTSVPSSPIVTTTVAVTRNADDLQYAASGNLVDAAGTLLCSVSADWSGVATNARIVGQNTDHTPLYYTSTPAASTYDGTTAVAGNADASGFADIKTVMAFSRWSGTALQAGSSGASGTEGAYDGGFTPVTDLHILNKNAASNFLQGTISDIRIYSKDLGTTVCESLTSAD